MNTISIRKSASLQNKQLTRKKQWITFKASELETYALKTYCQQTQRSKTNVLREIIRTLPTYINTPANL
jgi:hypothetical protein